MMKSLNDLAAEVHAANARWWYDENGVRLQRNKGELIALMHSELSEALEGERKDLPDDHLPHRRMAEVEMADVLIRLLDYCGAHGYDLQGACEEKLAYNAKRKDHTRAARNAKHGKKF
jgi:NTP pyrophosphatase (non-canonical NTP hydrolase)